MPSPQSDLETSLTQAYEQQLEQYLRALTLLEQVETNADGERDIHGSLHELAGVLDQVAACDRQISELKQQWAATKRQPGPRLQTMLSAIQSALEKLIVKTESAEGAARRARDRLLPQIDAASRRCKMQRAYGAAMANT